MKYFKKKALFLFILLLISCCYGANACELPAHPSAAAMPVLGQPGVYKVEEGNTFYYLVPEKTKVKMKIVWDPVCHNAESMKTEEYDGVVKEEIPIDNEVGIVNGYGFFPLGSMTSFFTLRGDRKDLTEAFTRETGISKTTHIISDKNLGPELALSSIFSTAPDLNFVILQGNGSASGYSDQATIPAVTERDENIDSINGLNSILPSTFMHSKIFMSGDTGSEDVFLIEGGKAKLINKKDDIKANLFSCRPLSDSDFSKLIVYSGAGIFLGDLEIKISEPTPDNYKAYIVDDGSNIDKVKVNNIGYNPNTTAANGGEDGYFNITFSTPSLTSTEGKFDSAKSTIKIMVNSPPAGYDLNKVFWVWEETVYERITDGKFELAEGENPDSSSLIDEPEPEDNPDSDTSTETDIDTGTDTGTETATVKKIDASKVSVYKLLGTKKCSAEVMITYSKPQDGTGFSAYRVYDNSGPKLSNLTITPVTGDSKMFYESGNSSDNNYFTTFNFSIDVLDSNPFYDKEFEYTPTLDDGKKLVLSQNKSKMNLSFYYNYPVYKYGINTTNIDNLNGFGLLDFPSDNKNGLKNEFIGYKHETKWLWQRIQTPDITIKEVKSEVIKDEQDRAIGSKTKITGNFIIKNPKPWHIDSDKFSVFALFKDSAGKTHLATDDFNTSNDPMNSMNFAADVNINEEDGKKTEFAIYPNKNEIAQIPSNGVSEDSYLVTYSNWTGPTDKWQAINHIKAEDKTAPEIQVIVYDTRTNRYHIFGSAKNTVADFIKEGSSSSGKKMCPRPYSYCLDWTSKIPPYINRDSAITDGYKYVNDGTGLKNLFNEYLNSSKPASKIFTEDKNCFVCQKNTRLVFTVHAFDNINYQETDGGLSSFKATLTDLNGNVLDEKNNQYNIHEPLQSVLRQENSVDKPYKLKVIANDKKGNSRHFELNINVLPADGLDIRTLGEIRHRID